LRAGGGRAPAEDTRGGGRGPETAGLEGRDGGAEERGGGRCTGALAGGAAPSSGGADKSPRKDESMM
jgi:hypothetical protein